jgi:hypothetical protein
MVHTIETTVIDEDIIKTAYEEQRAATRKDGASELKQEPLSMAQIVQEATELRLSFRNIFRIDNLEGFEKLTTLCLDNNIIEDIVNLSHLVNVQWLDLSFNNISVIQGLEKLTKLTDASFYNNSIMEIQGLDNCMDLNCLSIGNNSIKSLDNLMYLRKFKKLRLLNLEGNPVCHDPEYRMFVLAHIKYLKYLDYGLLSEADVVAAKEQYQDELLELEENEGIEDAAGERETQRKKQTSVLLKANLVEVETLFVEMFQKDTEIGKLKQFPGMSELLEDYRANFNALSEQFKVQGLERLDKRTTEYDMYTKALVEMQTENEATCVGTIEAFNRRKKHFFAELEKKDLIEQADFADLRREVAEMGEILLDLEMQVVQKAEDMIDVLENQFIDMKAVSLDAQQNWFRGVEAMEDAFFSGTTALLPVLLDNSQNDLLGDAVIDEVKNMLRDRDSCMGAATSSHDIHLGRLLEAEDEMREKEVAIFNGLVDGQRETEYKRNRTRVMEVEHLLNMNYLEMDDMIAQQNLEDEYGDGGLDD